MMGQDMRIFSGMRIDAEPHLLTQPGGNAVVTTGTFDANTGRPGLDPGGGGSG